MTALPALRRRILTLDEGLLRLWKRRDETARRIGHIKHTQGLPLENFEVEKAVLDHAGRVAKSLRLSPDRTQRFVRLLIESSLEVQERERIRRAARPRRALIVGGAGLMGAWFARFLEQQGFAVFVEDPRKSEFPKPPARGAPFDVVLIATPPSTVAGLIERHARKAGPKTLVADIASIKGKAAATLRKWAKRGKRVASLHPMFGPNVEVLMGRNVLVLDCGSRTGVRDAKALFVNTAARTRVLPIEAHDPLMADVLGLSHATSIAFNDALRARGGRFAAIEPFGSTTFRKQTELAREVAHENPALYFEIQRLNPKGADALARLERAVTALRRTVRSGDRAGFERRMRAAASFYGGGSGRR